MNAQGMAKGAFTRARNTLFNHINNDVEESTTLASKSQMEEQFPKLKEACLKYLEACQVDINGNQEEANYLNQPNKVEKIFVRFLETF